MHSIRYGVAAILICGIVVLIAGMEVVAWMTQAAVLSARQDLMSAQLLELRNLEDGFFDLETGQRGYLLSGDEIYTKRYIDGLRNFEDALSRLNQLFHDDPATLAQIEELAALAAVQPHEGERTTADFRGKAKTLSDRLDKARAAAVAQEVAGYRDVSALGLDVNALILLLVVVGIGFLSLSIRRLEEMQEQRAQQAMHDALTGLPNRRYLEEWLGIALAAAARNMRTLTLLYFDLDGFKGVNDRFGHEAGDRVLQEVATRLRRLLRSSDFVARLGGDEFVAALPEAAVDLSGLLQRLQRDLSRAQISELADGMVTASIGIARYPIDGEGVAALLGAADRAMYDAKITRRGGRPGLAQPALAASA